MNVDVTVPDRTRARSLRVRPMFAATSLDVHLFRSSSSNRRHRAGVVLVEHDLGLVVHAVDRAGLRKAELAVEVALVAQTVVTTRDAEGCSRHERRPSSWHRAPPEVAVEVDGMGGRG